MLWRGLSDSSQFTLAVRGTNSLQGWSCLAYNATYDLQLLYNKASFEVRAQNILVENIIDSSGIPRYQGSSPDDPLNSQKIRSEISLAAVRDATTSRLPGSIIDLGTNVQFAGGVLAHLSNFAEFASNSSWTASDVAGEMMSSLSINLTVSLLAFAPTLPSTDALAVSCSQTVEQDVYVYRHWVLFGWYVAAVSTTIICVALGLGK